MTDRPDPVESQYLDGIEAASRTGDSARAYELSIGLRQYRRFYKDREPTERTSKDR